MELAYHVVDVFTTTPLEGNPLAVFPDARELETNAMQRIARELNLSETTFVLPACHGGATRVRIFTPNTEMEFAGHPTIGTAYVMRRLGIVPSQATTFVLEENVGPVRIRVDAGNDPILWLTTPEIHDLGRVERELCAAAVSLNESDLLGDLACEVLSAGNPILFIPIKDPASVDRACIDTAALAHVLQRCVAAPCLFVFAPTGAGAYSRMFAPHLGVYEDPATGSATGPLAGYMMKYGLAARADGTRFLSEQGCKMGRRSLLHVLIHGASGEAGIEVGGNVTHVATGRLRVPSSAERQQSDVSICN
jgi:trans-2,3-dihydro-3-hydroxyanthranilate isomerase